jgi:DNA-directed RNA polymerase subunit beta
MAGRQRPGCGGHQDRWATPGRRRGYWFDIRPADDRDATQLESIKNSMEQTRRSFIFQKKSAKKLLNELQMAC